MNKAEGFCYNHTVGVVAFITTHLDPDIELQAETSKELVFKIPDLES